MSDEDVYDRWAMEDEFGDDLDDLATEIAVLRASEARQAADLAARDATIEELRAALRLDAETTGPCSECGGSGKVAEVAPAYMRSTYRCVSCGGTRNEET